MTDDTLTPEQQKEMQEVSHAIQRLLRPFSVEQRSAILADLTSLLFAGFQGAGAPELREELLAGHVKLIRDLIPINEKTVLERAKTAGSA